MATRNQARKSYTELMELPGYHERLEYLQLKGDNPGNANRAAMNAFYKSDLWKRVREEVIVRDLGRDLALEGFDISEGESIIVHHINPITEEDVEMMNPLIFDPENLITVSYDTHNKIHYRTTEQESYIERKPGDTKLW